MQALTLIGKVSGGKLPPAMTAQIVDALSQLDGKVVEVTLKVKERPRSLKQNAFYHGPFIQAFGWHLLECGQRVDPEDIHAGLRDAHAKNSYTIMLPGDIPFRVPPSTRRLTTQPFESYLEEIRAEFAQRLGWELPFPNEF